MYAIIIYYKPKKIYLEKINDLCLFFENLYIVDNSPTPTFKFNRLGNHNIKYLWYKDNKGISIPVNNIINSLASQSGYFALFDQDTIFSLDAIGMMVRFIDKIKHIKNIGVITPVIYDNGRILGSFNKNHEFDYVESFINSGSFFNIEIFKNIGGFDEKLFLDCVDHEYAIRLLKNGYKIMRYNKVTFLHTIGENSRQFNFFGFKIVFRQHNSIRKYYIIKNNLYLGIKHKKMLVRSIFYVILSLFSILFYEDCKYTKLKMAIRGIKDAFQKKWGKAETVLRF